MTDGVVLLVEPDETDRRRLTDRLESRGQSAVTTATSVESALETIDRRHADCLLTEYELPDGTGIELFERARNRRPTIAGLLWTAHGSERVASDALAAGFNGYVSKADGIDLLLTRLDDVVALGLAEPARRAPDTTGSAAVVEQAPMGIIEWDSDLTVTDWNPGASEIFGYTRSEAVGQHATELLVPDDAEWLATRDWQRLLRNRASSCRINENVRKDGRTITCEWYNAPLDDGDDLVGVLSFVQDVTSREQRRQHLQVFNRVLRHDLRNSMNIVRGSVEQLAETDPGTTEATHLRAIVTDRVDELVDLADKTRTIERIVGTDAAAVATIDLVSVVETTIGHVLDRFPDATVELSHPDQALAHVHEVVPIGLEEVLRNAIEHHPETGPCIDVEITHDEEAVVVTIADDGPGIPTDERALFEGDQEITQLTHSSGVGLWITYWAVRASSGTLAFPERDQGTTVRITVPKPVDESDDEK